MIEINLATKLEINQILNFFERYISNETDWIFWWELLCPFWLKWAIIRNQVIIIKENNDILWFLRFYKKKNNIVSVYQFALSEEIRWKWIIKKCLEKTWYTFFETQCQINSKFNEYYKKTWWELFKNDENFNYWKINL